MSCLVVLHRSAVSGWAVTSQAELYLAFLDVIPCFTWTSTDLLAPKQYSASMLNQLDDSDLAVTDSSSLLCPCVADAISGSLALP